MKLKRDWKRRIARILSAVMILTCLPLCDCQRVKAASFYTGSITEDSLGVFQIEDEVLVGYTGEGGDVVIPSEINGNKVTVIGEDAFFGCDSLRSISIPNSVTSIESAAFADCSNLKSVSIPESVTKIGDAAFEYCSSLKSIDIPESVTDIGSWAFRCCESLEGISIPKNVTSIGTYVFQGCYNLESIKVDAANPVYDSRENCNALIMTSLNVLIKGCNNTIIPEGVTSIEIWAFSGCDRLESISIPYGVEIIGTFAFADCKNLKSISIPDSVTSIQLGAFDDCNSLESIIIPKSVISIGEEGGESFGTEGIFCRCSNLAEIRVEEGNPVYDSRKNCNAIIETETNKLISGCKNTIIPDNVVSIGNDAFNGCSNLGSISIPGSVTSIGDGAFADCSNLKRINIPESVTSIGQYALGYYELEKIPNFIIYGISGTEAETYAKNNGMDFRLFSGEEKSDISAATIILERDSYTYDGTAKTPSVTVKLGEKTLDVNVDYIVSYSDNIEIGTAKATITGIGNYTGSAEKSFIIKESGYIPVTEVRIVTPEDGIEDGRIEVGKNFVLSAQIIPSNATNQKVFWTSSNPEIAEITQEGAVTTVGVGDVVFTVTSEDGEKQAEYKVRVVQKTAVVPEPEIPTTYAYKLNADKTTITITKCTSSATDVIIPSSIDGYAVTGIDEKAFQNITSMKTVSFPAGLKNIGQYAFEGCTALTTVVLPDSLINLGEYAFKGCVSLQSAKLNVDRKNVTEGLFSGCSSLSSVILPGTVQYIRPNAFRGCTSLKTLNLPKSISIIFANAFLDSGIKNIIYQGTSADWKTITIAATGNTSFLNAVVTGSDGKTFSADKSRWNTENPVKKPSVSKVKSFKAKAGRKRLTLSWKKLSGASGYQVQISTKRNFKGAKTKPISKSKRSYTKTGLKAKKMYYARIRAYKTYKDANGKIQKSYGKWSTVRKKTK